MAELVDVLCMMRPTRKADDGAFVIDLEPTDSKGPNGTVVHGSPPGSVYDRSDSPDMAEVGNGDTPGADTEFVTDAWG